MGQRVKIQVINDEGFPCVTLYANCHHPDVDVDGVVAYVARQSIGPTSFTSEMLKQKYPEKNETVLSQAGEPIFTIEPTLGRYEHVLLVDANTMMVTRSETVNKAA